MRQHLLIQLVIQLLTGRHQEEAPPVAAKASGNRLAAMAARLAVIERRLTDAAAKS